MPGNAVSMRVIGTVRRLGITHNVGRAPNSVQMLDAAKTQCPNVDSPAVGHTVSNFTWTALG